MAREDSAVSCATVGSVSDATPNEPTPCDTHPLELGLLGQAAVSAAGAGLGLVAAGPAGALVGAVLPQLMEAAVRMDERARTHRLERAARTLGRASDVLNVGLPELERLATRDEARTELLARVLAASAHTATAAAKVEALGRVLADGLRDDARLDEALLLAAALHDLEAPHVRLLVAMGYVGLRGGTPPTWEWMDPWAWNNHEANGYTMRDLASAAGGDVAAPAVLAVLQRHGLVAAGNGRRDVMAEISMGARQGSQLPRLPSFEVTRLGTVCLRLLVPEVPEGRRHNPWELSEPHHGEG